MCTFNKGLITKRHDFGVQILAEAMEKEDRKVMKEKTWRVRRDGKGMENIRPDVSIQEKDELLLLELTCPYDKSSEELDRRLHEKESKYNWLKPENIGMEGINSIRVVAISIGSCGTITKLCKQRLKSLKILKIAGKLQKAVMRGSASIVSCHLSNDEGG